MTLQDITTQSEDWQKDPYRRRMIDSIRPPELRKAKVL